MFIKQLVQGNSFVAELTSFIGIRARGISKIEGLDKYKA